MYQATKSEREVEEVEVCDHCRKANAVEGDLCLDCNELPVCAGCLERVVEVVNEEGYCADCMAGNEQMLEDRQNYLEAINVH